MQDAAARTMTPEQKARFRCVNAGALDRTRDAWMCSAPTDIRVLGVLDFDKAMRRNDPQSPILPTIP